MNSEDILKAADFEVEIHDRFAALPSHDIAITATVRATCAAVNTCVRDAVAGVTEVLALATGVVRGEVEASHFNFQLQKLRELVGITE